MAIFLSLRSTLVPCLGALPVKAAHGAADGESVGQHRQGRAAPAGKLPSWCQRLLGGGGGRQIPQGKHTPYPCAFNERALEWCFIRKPFCTAFADLGLVFFFVSLFFQLDCLAQTYLGEKRDCWR